MSDNSTKSSQIKIALLVIAALAIMIFGFNFLKGKSLFSKQKNYYATFNSAQGLENAHKVVLLGVEIGKVTSVDFIDNFERIQVSFTTDETIKIPNDSKVFIEPGIPGFGSPSLKLNLGKSTDFYANGAELATTQPVSMTDKAMKIVDNLEPTTKNINSVLTSADSVAMNINNLLTGQNKIRLESTITSLEKTVKNFNQTSTQINDLLKRQTPVIESTLQNFNGLSKTLADNQAKIDAIITNLSKTTSNLSELELKETLTNVNTTFAQLQSILEKVDHGDGSISLLLNNAELYNNLNNTSRDLDRLILDLQENPKEYIPDVSVFGKKKKRTKQ